MSKSSSSSRGRLDDNGQSCSEGLQIDGLLCTLKRHVKRSIDDLRCAGHLLVRLSMFRQFESILRLACTASQTPVLKENGFIQRDAYEFTAQH